jgi:hypothetical protein
MREVCIWVNRTSTNVERSVWRQVVAGQPSHMAGWPGGVASTDSGFSSLCRYVATKAQARMLQTLADQQRSCAGRLALGPLSLGSGPLGPHVKYTPVVMMILTFCQLHFVIP